MYLTGAKYMPFAQGVEEGLIRFVGDDCKRALYDAIEDRQVRPGLCKTAGLKLVYSPLNGSGLSSCHTGIERHWNYRHHNCS